MTHEELLFLKSPEARSLVEENLHRDPLEVALDRSVPQARLVAGQVKYLRKAASKLPSFYNARCIITQKAYEQSSSEQIALEREFDGGKLCIDLTCGLGVDSWALSKKFDKVIAVEKDVVSAEIAEFNFALLGCGNVTVVNSSAEGFIAANRGLKAALIFADPDRRDADGKKMVTLADSSPDILTLLPDIRDISDTLAVKLSPLFDVSEAFRLLGSGTRVDVISMDGECKEVFVVSPQEGVTNIVRAVITGGPKIYRSFPVIKTAPGAVCFVEDASGFPLYKFLVVPDVALSKAGIALSYFTEKGCYMGGSNSFAFSVEDPGKVPGKKYAVREFIPYSPKKLRSLLKSNGKKALNILRRDFTDPNSVVASALGIREGGQEYAAVTTLGEKKWFILLDRL